MIKYFSNRLQNSNLIILLFIDTASIVVSLILSILLRYDLLFPQELSFVLEIKFLLSTIFLKIFCFRYFNLYRGMWRYTSIFDIIRIVKGNIISTFLFVLIIYLFYSFNGYSRAIFIIDFVLCTVFIGCSRVGIRMFFSNLFSSNNHAAIKKNIIIIGAGFTGEIILRESLKKKGSQINVIGFLDDDIRKQYDRLHDIPILGKVSDLSKLSLPYDEIYICTPSANKNQMRTIVNECKKTKKIFKTLPSISELIEGKVSVSLLREVSPVDLLGRKEILLDTKTIKKFIRGKRVLVTGAGGSIGSELVRQCIRFKPSLIIMIDSSELNLFQIEQETLNLSKTILFKPVLQDIRDKEILNNTFEEFKPQVVFHAAAYKHVPIQEQFPHEAIKTNIYGTINLTELATKHLVENFVLVSTDKAVRPTNVMGATKRIAELICKNENTFSKNTEFMSVRFGNVLGSSGSVIPTFKKQIKNGGPVTITDPDMERYFMSIPEASQLILQAGSLGVGGEIFILDMGKPVKIIDLAKDLIKLSGLEPEDDIQIKITGARPGEKKIEELSLDSEHLVQTKHNKIFILKDLNSDKKIFQKLVNDLLNLKNKIKLKSAEEIRFDLSKILPDYSPNLSLNIINNNEDKAKA